jgi:hypothetical protein
MKSYYSICYVSRTNDSLTDDELERLFDYSMQHNNERNISGILLEGSGNFFQVLEGNEEAVTSLYNKIEKDERHGELFEIFNGRCALPIFGTYDSKFNVVKTLADLNAINEFLTLRKSHPVSGKLQRLLKPFLLMREA